MYYFKETEKEKVLQGRTLVYLANNVLHMNVSYLSTILAGKRSCSIRLAEDITKCASPIARLEDYFVKVEK